MKMLHPLALLRTRSLLACAVWATCALLAACGSDTGGSTSCETAADCESGEVCTENACVAEGDTTGLDADADDGAAEDTDTGTDTTPDVADGAADAREDTVDTGQDTGTDAADAAPDGSSFPTLANYRACDSDIDCPVGLGNCITDIGLSSRDPVFGERIAISDIDPDWPRAGICSLACATDPSICDTLQLRDGAGRPVPFECALLAEGTVPYPIPAPDFPFADTLDPVAIAAGVPFAAVCRPPFELDPANSNNFCFDCDGTNTCGEGDVCWSFANKAEADSDGSCLMACEDNSGCPLGFSCDELSDLTDDGPSVLGNFCVPATQTCGLCRDLDGDFRGVGVCGPSGSIVAGVDCDDQDPTVYYSDTDPDHAFPELCGDFDYNCNGVADSDEQIGADAYPVEHCTGCGERCEGVEPNATLRCQTNTDTGQPFCGVVCDDPTNFVDCEPDVPGCETAVTDASRLFYRDVDGDGAGDPLDSVFACVAGEAPEGYVANSADCNDDNDAVYGAFGDTAAPAEVCDGIDNDCVGGIDDQVATVGSACTTGQPGVCSPGTLVCNGAAGLVCSPNVTPTAEICDGLDNDCDGGVDDPAEIVGLGASCAGAGEGVCSQGTQVCSGVAGLTCESRLPDPGIDEPDASFIDSNCDGIDGQLDIAIFVSPFGSDTSIGSRTQPVRSLARAAAIAATTPAEQPSQILMETGVYESQATTYVTGFISIAGGYTQGTDNAWTRGPGRATLRANLPPGVRTPGFAYNPTFYGNQTLITDVNVEVSTTGTSGESAIAMDCTNCSGTRLNNVDISAGPGAIGVNGTTQVSAVGGLGGIAGADGASPSSPDFHNPPANPADRCTGLGGELGDFGAFGPYYGQGGYGRRGLQRAASAGNFGLDIQAAPLNVPPFPTVYIGAAGGTPIESDGATDGAAGAVRSIFQPAAAGGANTGVPNPSEGSYSFFSGWIRPGGQTGASGFDGVGGGGGAGGGFACCEDGFSGAGGGTPGCRGDGATGGGPGGSSIGLVLVSTTNILFNNVAITAATGGAGGQGGNGGFGGSGAAGGTPHSVSRERIGYAGGASSGGQGGNGGGGGAGGSAFALLRPAATSISGSPRLSSGGAGSGGRGGAGGPGGTHGAPTLFVPSASGVAGLPGAVGESLQDRTY